MVYLTGDIHADPIPIEKFCKRMNPTAEDIIIILGDVGANYFCDFRDETTKNRLNRLGLMIFCIHGNHEARPQTIPTYHEAKWNGGMVLVEDKYPNVLFAKDGEIFDLEGKKAIVLGGAYSVDKYYRLMRGYHWWSDEQPSEEIKQYAEQQLDRIGWSVDVVLSHTCPLHYEPIEMFLPGIDQSTVDASTEEWLGEIEKKLNYNKWFCGHWHINKRIDKMHFLMHDFEALEDTHD